MHCGKKRLHSAYISMWLSFSALVLVLLITMTFVMFYLFNDRYTEAITENQVSVIEQDSMTLEHLIVSRAAAIGVDLSENAAYRSILGAPVTNPDALNVNLKNVYDTLCNVFATNSDLLGQVMLLYPGIHSSVSNISGYKRLDEPANEALRALTAQINQAMTARKCWVYLPPAAERSAAFIYALSPFWGGRENNDARIFLFLKEDRMTALLNQIKGEAQTLYICNAAGEILISTEPAAEAAMPADVRALLQEGEAAYCVNHSLQKVYALRPVGKTGMFLAAAQPINSWYASIYQVRNIVLLSSAAALLLALIFVLALSRRLYAPLKIVTEMVSQLPFIKKNEIENEYQLIETGMNELSSLLSDTQRVIFNNQTLLKNQSLLRFIKGHTEAETLETLSWLHVDMPLEGYLLLGMEYCEDDAKKAPAEGSRFVAVKLIERVERAFNRGAEGRVYGAMAEENRIYFLVNCPPSGENSPPLCRAISAYCAERRIRCYLAAAPGPCAREELLQCYEEIKEILACRFFDLREEPVHLSALAKRPGDLLRGYMRQLSGCAKTEMREIRLLYEKIFQCMEGLAPREAYYCLIQCVTHLKRFGLKTLEDELALERINSFQDNFWNVAEIQRLIEKMLEDCQADAPETAPEDAAFIASVRACIQRHLQDELSLEEVGERLHFNAKYLSRKFKAITGTTLNDYITRIRMENAVNLLNQGDDSIERVARKCGYKATQYFIRRFKETYGITPGEYRKESVRLGGTLLNASASAGPEAGEAR